METQSALSALLDAIHFGDLIAIMIGCGTAGISFILATIGVKKFWRLLKGI
ncbi:MULTISPECIES: hypothetical protein [Klebsiella]|uniref:Uncharacterized protein n=1 Tax=Klebsiella quasipneumoniae TaxID=1463165 RepID=A0A8I0A111_9ENTR|nr:MULTISPECIES: hypothetical protein [Klebsiella]MBC5049081.1 hypothetical protein [Klebsiella quasipneumoniae]UNX76627.1 hypothetical protein MQE09_26275 [Klebsiella aerogenes]